MAKTNFTMTEYLGSAVAKNPLDSTGKELILLNIGSSNTH